MLGRPAPALAAAAVAGWLAGASLFAAGWPGLAAAGQRTRLGQLDTELLARAGAGVAIVVAVLVWLLVARRSARTS
jgi:hypothetical protein